MYQLSASCKGHRADVRAIASKNSTFYSTSRDSTTRTWSFSDGAWSPKETYSVGDEGFVNAATVVGDVYLATAGQDAVIRLWLLPDESHSAPAWCKLPMRELRGHSLNVCSLTSLGKWILSTSWDKTARLWDADSGDCIAVLRGHEQAVWSGAFLSDTNGSIQVLTASADTTIRQWSIDQGGTSVSTVGSFLGHRDAVRGLAVLGKYLVSASNDQTVAVWDLQSRDLLKSLVGHSSFVYSVAPVSDDVIATASEDHTVRVWSLSESKCLQAIVIPAVSAWTVAANSTGDIAVGSSDGVVRIFSERQGVFLADDSPALVEYNDEVTNFERALAEKGQGSNSSSDAVDVNALPGTELLDTPGTKDGQVAVVRSAPGVAEAYNWSVLDQRWISVGQVVGSQASQNKTAYQGKEYDFVFDVDVQDGVPPLKLPYNKTDDPRDAADAFLARHHLPAVYHDQVVSFIETNAGVSAQKLGSFTDPYTGTSRYQPASSSASQTAAGNADPYTGASSYQATPKPSAKKILPHKSILTFDTINAKALLSRADLIVKETAALSSEQLQDIHILADSLQGDVLSVFCTKQQSLIDALTTLPFDKRLPFYDLARFLALKGCMLPLYLYLEPLKAPSSKAKDVNLMLCLRAVANSFSGAPTFASDNVVEILQSVEPPSAETSENCKTALATVLLNITISDALQEYAEILPLLSSIIQAPHPEAVYRALVALGNLVVKKKVQLTDVVDILSTVNPIALTQDRVTDLLNEIQDAQ